MTILPIGMFPVCDGWSFPFIRLINGFQGRMQPQTENYLDQLQHGTLPSSQRTRSPRLGCRDEERIMVLYHV